MSAAAIRLGLAVLLLPVALAAPAAGQSNPRYDLYLPFNGGSGSALSLTNTGTGSLSVTIATASGGTMRGVVRTGNGRAARTPGFDGTGKAVILVRPTDAGDPLSPADTAFSFGAEFRLDATTSGRSDDNGDNLMQRGLFGDAAQYKIQLDDRRVSCRIKGNRGALKVVASRPVEAGQWYRARCTRDGQQVKLRIVTLSNGRITDHVARGAVGALRLDGPPLSIGGKVDRSGRVLVDDSDQFNGRIDNVFFELRN